jgi:iron complex outermembrane receptor protein
VTPQGQTVSIQSLETLNALNLVSMSAGWEHIFGGPVDLSAFVTNLTNKKYFSFVSGLYGTLPVESASLGEPRMFGFRLKYRFGGMANEEPR